MKTILKFVLFIAIPLILSAVILVLASVLPIPKDSYMDAIIDKVERLDCIDSPKIVVVGGSSVAFGIDSAMLEEQSGMPVVNMGLHAGLGQPFHTELLRESINPGDIIIILPERYHDSTTHVASTYLARQVINADFSLWNRVSGGDKMQMMKDFFLFVYTNAIDVIYYMTPLSPSAAEPPISRSAFNEYGDNIFAGDIPVFIAEDSPVKKIDILSDEMQQYWNEYNSYVTERGALLLMGAPPLLDISLSSDTDLAAVQLSLEERLNFPVISNLDDHVWSIEYFYNDDYHLNALGKAVNTQQLIIGLEDYLK